MKKAIEAILFMAGNPVKADDLAKVLGASKEEVMAAAQELSQELKDRGVVLTQVKESFQMATSPEVSDTVKQYIQAQLREKLTEAAMETLAIITYKQPVSKAEIEAIRGVNSQYILKLLLQRGLIEKTSSSTDARVSLYQTTHEFLHHLGIQSQNQLPDFEEIVKNITLPDLASTD